jgi:putative nucleotidyltransferase with HDIG domain
VVLIVVITMKLHNVAVPAAEIVAILGLSVIGFTSWLQGKKIFKVVYQQELCRLQSLIQLTEEKHNNGKNILGAIRALAATVDARDKYTYGHSNRVAKYATEIAQELGYSHGDLETLRVAALLHDTGKIGVPDKILRKRGFLSRIEQKKMRSHPELGVAIIKHIDSLEESLTAILHHHERYDGNGYPQGLEGISIPLNARIISVADAYDAMISERSYRSNKLSGAQALGELIKYAGSQFDPMVVKAFADFFKKSKAEYKASQIHTTIVND